MDFIFRNCILRQKRLPLFPKFHIHIKDIKTISTQFNDCLKVFLKITESIPNNKRNMKPIFKCNICLNTFTQKKNLKAHLSERRCKSNLLKDLNELNDILKDFDIVEHRAKTSSEDNLKAIVHEQSIVIKKQLESLRMQLEMITLLKDDNRIKHVDLYLTDKLCNIDIELNPKIKKDPN